MERHSESARACTTPTWQKKRRRRRIQEELFALDGLYWKQRHQQQYLIGAPAKNLQKPKSNADAMKYEKKQ